MNSGHDDFSVSIDLGGGTGYFSSNRPGGKGSDDIYSFVQTKPLIIEACSQYIAGTLRDRTTDLPLAHAGIQLFDAHGNLVQSLTTDDGAEFRFLVGCGTQYRIEASKEGYLDDQRTVVTDTQRKVVQDGSLTLLSIMERDRLEALVLKEKQEEAERLAKTMAEQQAREEKKAEEKRVQLERETAQRKAIAQEKNVRERQMEIERAIENEPLIVRENGRTIINIPEIHFDYSLWYLRREARERLGQVVELLNDHPGIVLEIGTHTDVRGNAEYNRDLSQKRADVAKAFLVKSGITGNRIIAKGYGESNPIVVCGPEDNCTEEDHEWNRRCELVIVKWE